MGTYWKIVNLTKREQYESPGLKESTYSPARVMQLLFGRWAGDEIRIVNDEFGDVGLYHKVDDADWPNVYAPAQEGGEVVEGKVTAVADSPRRASPLPGRTVTGRFASSPAVQNVRPPLNARQQETVDIVRAGLRQHFGLDMKLGFIRVAGGESDASGFVGRFVTMETETDEKGVTRATKIDVEHTQTAPKPRKRRKK